jgi:hypothetical protein
MRIVQGMRIELFFVAFSDGILGSIPAFTGTGFS